MDGDHGRPCDSMGREEGEDGGCRGSIECGVRVGEERLGSDWKDVLAIE